MESTEHVAACMLCSDEGLHAFFRVQDLLGTEFT